MNELIWFKAKYYFKKLPHCGVSSTEKPYRVTGKSQKWLQLPVLFFNKMYLILKIYKERKKYI